MTTTATTPARTLPRVSDERFFAVHYPRLAPLLRDFSQAIVCTRKPLDPEQDLGAAVRLGQQILAETAAAVGGEPAAEATTRPQDFVAAATRLADLLGGSVAPSDVATAQELHKHLDYLQRHVPAASLATAGTAATKLAFVRDAIFNCIHSLANGVLLQFRWACPDPRQVTDFYDMRAVEAAMTPAARGLIAASQSLEGWCSPRKALLLYALAREHKPETAVEIGIFGGRSIVPIAAALRDNGRGHVCGIETWSGAAATTHRTDFSNDFWWMNVDLGAIKKTFLQFVVAHDLHDVIKVVEAPSAKCPGLFERIDLLHIDGGHSTFDAAQDVVNYVTKVPPGGIVVFDDINWKSTAAGLEIIRDCCRLLHVVPAFGSETEPGCAAFVKV